MVMPVYIDASRAARDNFRYACWQVFFQIGDRQVPRTDYSDFHKRLSLQTNLYLI